MSLMVTCLVELHSVDPSSSYAHIFTALRQFALHLRTAFTTPDSREAFTSCINWPVLSCCRAITAILCSSYEATSHREGTTTTSMSSPLHDLLYPLVQVLQGLARLASPTRYYPYRLHIAALLCELQWASGSFIPTCGPLLEMLNGGVLGAGTHKPKAVAPNNPTPLAYLIKAAPALLDTRAVQDAMVSKILQLILDSLKSQWRSPALPEIG